MTKLYFAYGANMSLDSMGQRCPQAEPVGPAYLNNWQLVLTDHATVMPAPGERVPGALWRITNECERNLDVFEGWPTYYRKETVKIRGNEVMIYVMNDPDPYGHPSDYYVELLRDGYRDWDLPHDALNKSLNEDLCHLTN